MPLKHNEPQARKKSQELLGKYRYCWRCGSPEGLSVHHDDKNRLNNSSKNVFVLCFKCHGAIHGRDKKLGRDRHLVNLTLFTPEVVEALTIKPTTEGGKIYENSPGARPARPRKGGKRKKSGDPNGLFAADLFSGSTRAGSDPGQD
jgi:hypothetical protein